MGLGFIVLFIGMFKRLMILPKFSFIFPVYNFFDSILCRLSSFDKINNLLRMGDLILSQMFGGYLLVSVVKKNNI